MLTIKDLKSIIANLNDDYKVSIEDIDDNSESYNIHSIEVCPTINEVVLRRWKN